MPKVTRTVLTPTQSPPAATLPAVSPTEEAGREGLLWKVPLDGPATERLSVRRGMVYVQVEIEDEPWMYAFDGASGKRLWASKGRSTLIGNVTCKRETYLPRLGIDDGIYVWDDGYLRALDGQTGKERWRFPVYGGIEGGLARVGDVLYLGGSDEYVYAVEAGTGAPLWRNHIGQVWLLLDMDGLLYVQRQNRGYGLDPATGQEVWAIDGTSFVAEVADGTLYVTFGGEIYAYEVGTGALRWRFEMREAAVCPWVYAGLGRRIYVSGGDAVYALNSDTGELQWRSEYPYPPAASRLAAAVEPAALLVDHDNSGSIHALDPSSGAERWRFQPPDRDAIRSMATTAKVIYLGMWDGHLYALDAATGVERWRFRLGNAPVVALAPAEGKIYAVTLDAYLHAVSGPERAP